MGCIAGGCMRIISVSFPWCWVIKKSRRKDVKVDEMFFYVDVPGTWFMSCRVVSSKKKRKIKTKMS